MMDAVRRRGGTLLGGRPVRAVVRLATVAVTLLAAVAGCAAPQEGRALATGSVTAGLDPTGIVRGSDGSDDDRVAAATVRNLEIYWEREYPRLAGGRPFPPLAGSYSVDSTLRGRGSAVPCSGDPAELEGNAYYCPRADVLAFDRSALVPVLREDFGDAAVVVVLAHEFGHAVQQRLGATGAVGPGSPGGSLFGGPQFFAPTILLEGQADCYAAAFLRQVRDGALPDLRTGTSGVDDAMSALVTFRDPVGTGASDADAHGNAYDRVSSFQMGFEGGPGTCAGMTVTNRLFTQRSFTSLSDAQSGGNLPLEQLVTALGSDLDRFYAQVVRARGRPWTAPRSVAGVGCDGADPQGAVSYCPGERTVAVDAPAAQVDHRSVGDFATGTRLASRYGLATLGALGRPTNGPDAGRAALCLAGAYTASVGAPGTDFSLSPGDLDEAVSLLLRDADASRGSDGVTSRSTAYARITDFRAGIDGGPDACLGAG